MSLHRKVFSQKQKTNDSKATPKTTDPFQDLKRGSGIHVMGRGTTENPFIIGDVVDFIKDKKDAVPKSFIIKVRKCISDDILAGEKRELVLKECKTNKTHSSVKAFYTIPRIRCEFYLEILPGEAAAA